MTRHMVDVASGQRSCRECNRKKIRCSKTAPCSHCVRRGLDCVFPGPSRAPRRKKRPLKAELVARLKSLEQELADRAGGPPVGGAADRHGTLLVGGDFGQSVNHEAFLSLSGQIKEQRNHGNQFVFGHSSLADSLREYHPTTTHSQWLWQAYDQNVAPVISIFHRPSLHRMITKASTNPEHLDRSSEAVVFAVYFAAATSMRPEDCLRDLGEEHPVVLQRYRFATQQALSRAGFLQSRSLPVLQATVFFLTCLRDAGDADFVWTMVAAVHRLAQGLGLHRDGTHFGLTPFETEMRRRLWWSIYLLDTRSSQSYPTGSLVSEGSYDTSLPLNINDSDIAPESADVPELAGFSEMTFCLIRCEMTVLVRRNLNAQDNTDGEKDLENRLHEVEKVHVRLHERYLRFCDVSIPIQWTTATVIRLALARLWLVTHLPRWRLNDPVASPKREQLFLTAIEVVGFAHLLETDPRTSKWSWLFEGYMQWQAVTLVLAGMCGQPSSPVTDRAWVVVNQAVARWASRDQRGVMMRPISRLMERAAVAHNKELMLKSAIDVEPAYLINNTMDLHEIDSASPSRNGEDLTAMDLFNDILGENA
ncbi:hypothetical protein BO78DRAFT_465396 [Aspergillus sclerotiicarbonarius CBS 121057]|uniref:Zn(2)-C6 fungal-type domain-containing protein n=1 Tax=Aspergillus sclerotiicarbonarius (strain CBS 121057 / IBT 28362) TaxID=1448318 RepID=A0A319DRL1_ASPSB|nr:hypothetical protein BO78DRAFT_465396 [Aspergillus sclerotiicarbonarius CBS 121057]